MKYCIKCGAEIDDNSRYCTVCGAVQEEPDVGSQSESANSGEYTYDQNQGDQGSQATVTVPTERSIGLAIVLTIITCGIYGLYWLAMLNNELNEEVQDYNAPSGGMVVVLALVTCGIYTLYWFYKAGEKVNIIRQKRHEIGGGNESIVYLVLGIFGLGIISYALIQSELNYYNKM